METIFERMPGMKRQLRIAIFASCLSLASCSSCLNLVDCSGDYLFQDWTEVSSTSMTPPPYLDLSGAHFGSDQLFYIGSCEYRVDIESDTTGLSGSFSLSDPNPNTEPCIAQETTETYEMTCTSLVVTVNGVSTTYAPPPDSDDSGSFFGRQPPRH